MKNKLSHTDHAGKARMVDVSGKPEQERMARAEGFIHLEPGTIGQVKENTLKKGDVLSTARIAGIQAAKQTHLLIPLCHPLPISKVDLDFNIGNSGIRVETMVKCTGRTGVEMEALTAAGVALLTVYDMCKAVDKSMVIGDVKLVEKKKD